MVRVWSRGLGGLGLRGGGGWDAFWFELMDGMDGVTYWVEVGLSRGIVDEEEDWMAMPPGVGVGIGSFERMKSPTSSRLLPKSI